MSFGEGIRFQKVMKLCTRFHTGNRNDLWLETGCKYITDHAFKKIGMAGDNFNDILSCQ